MTFPAIFVLLLLGLASILFVTEWLRADLVALLLVITLGASGILTPQETLSGFSRSAVITILAIFILTAGITKTGAMRQLGSFLVREASERDWALIALLMAAGATLSLVMNNIAAASVLLPVALTVSRERKVSPSKLMMPLAFATELGGMATLLTTANILVSSALRDRGYQPFGLLDFAPIGVPVVLVGIAYMTVIGRHLLPRRAPADWQRLMSVSRSRLDDVYALRERWVQARIPAGSPLLGHTLVEAGLGHALGVNVVAVFHHGNARLAPPPSERLQVRDTLFLQAREEQLDSLRTRGLEIQPGAPLLSSLNSGPMALFEMVLAPRSRALGKTLRDLHLRDKFGANVLAIWREGRPHRVGLADMPLQLGDVLLALGARERAGMLQDEADFIVVADSLAPTTLTQKTPHALAIMAAALILAATGILPTAEAVLAGAVAMVLAGVLSMDEAYQAIEWKSIFLIAAMLPVGIALNKTGAADALGQGLVSLLGAFGPLTVIAGLLVLTTVLTQVMSGQATAVVIAPIAIGAAEVLHANPRAFAIAVAYGCSLSFLTPLGHPANVFVMGPGGYRFVDFLRVGVWLTLILIGVIVALLPLTWGL